MMKQVFLRNAKAVVEDVPAPVIGEGEALVRVVRSCISTGTELSGILPSKSSRKAPEPSSPSIPLWKTLIDPDLLKRAFRDTKKVARVFSLMRERGLTYTMDVVKQQLSLAYPLGYSAAGVVLETSPSIRDIAPGDRVACAGAQCAHHAEIISVPRNLLVPVPDGVSFDEAATVAPGSIAMQGVRRACPTLGERFVVIGMGLIGQLVVQLLKATGCRVIGTDIDQRRIQKAMELGMDHGLNSGDGDLPDMVKRLTDGDGADGVIVAASGTEQILSDACKMCRKKGRVVLVGDVTINIKREDMYRKELDFFISTSYGPGRYDDRYEHGGIDYPVSQVRWTENRSMGEYLRLIAGGRIRIQPIIGEVCPIEKAEDAYFRLKNHPDKPLMVLLSYPEHPAVDRTARKWMSHDHKPPEGKRLRVAVIGAGGFSKSIHLPNMKRSDMYTLQAIVERKGNDAIAAAKQFNARYATTDFHQVIEDPDIDAVFITTRHNLHAPLAIEALRAGKHVFVEKPLAMNRNELDAVRNLVQSPGEGNAPFIMTGFNRRFSPFARKIRELTCDRKRPMLLNYRMNAGYIPLDHWVHGDEGGGRNVGEACHVYDLFTYLTDSRVHAVGAKSMKPSTGYYSSRDNFIATVSFEDGSVATLVYTAMGSDEYPKEHLDVVCDSRVFVINDYTMLTCYGIEETSPPAPSPPAERGLRGEVLIKAAGDKGHLREITEFAHAALDSQPCPIPFWQQYQAMDIAFEVDRLMSRWK